MPKIISQLPLLSHGCKGKCDKVYPKENITNIHGRYNQKDTRKCSLCEITIIHAGKETKCRCCNQKLRSKPLAPIKDINERESKIKRI